MSNIELITILPNLAEVSNVAGFNTGDETQVTIKNKLGASNVSSDGYITATDWNIFNNKVDTEDLAAYVPTSTTVNGHALVANVSVTASDIGLGAVSNVNTTVTSNITDSTNKRFVTDADLVKLSNVSGVNTGDETNTTIKAKLGAATGSNDGYLTATDWNIFSNAATTGVTGVYTIPMGIGLSNVFTFTNGVLVTVT